MKRRTFLKLGGIGAALPLGSTLQSGEAPRSGTVREPARDVPVADTADVVVCGGGPAGVAAAVAAARQQAKVILIESQGALGGIWTTGLLSWILDHANKGGLMREMLERLDGRKGRLATPRGAMPNSYDVELMKFTLEEMCREAGVEIQLHTRVCAVLRDGSGRMRHVLTESKSGREAIAGKVFIDCTGDGDVGALAGGEFAVGHPETKRTQPMSLMALVTGINAKDVAAYYREDEHGEWAPPKDRLRAEMEKGGHSPSYAKPSLFRVREDLFALMANHEYGCSGLNAREVTKATLQARRELHALVNGLRSVGGAWRDLRLVATAEQIGVREGRRLRGLYTLSAEDLRAGRAQEDAVCKVTFPVDVHSTNPAKEKGIERIGWRAKPYDIPLRSLISGDIPGLMMAGRCISGDFIAHSSYRVTGNAVPMGEAAGKVAALAARTGRLPQEVKWSEVS